MCAGRAPLHTKAIGYLLGAQPVDEAAHHLPLALGQELQHPQRVIAANARPQGGLQQERIHREVSLICQLHRLDDHRNGLLLANETLGTLGDGVRHRAALVVPEKITTLVSALTA